MRFRASSEAKAQREASVRVTNDDPRVAVVTRLIGDNRNAPNLWLARHILLVLTDLAPSCCPEDQLAREATLHRPENPQPSTGYGTTN
jgi:hypothetical protein